MPDENRLGNRILERLPPRDLDEIWVQLERVTPALDAVVAEPGVEPRWVCFPVSGVLSSMVVLEGGATVEASTIGNEGTDGLCLPADPYRVHVHAPDEMRRLSVAARRYAHAESPALSILPPRYALVLI